METRAINKLNKIAKTGLLVCWFGLSLTIGAHYIDVPKLQILELIAYILSQLDIFSNLKGGQPLDPSDFVM